MAIAESQLIIALTLKEMEIVGACEEWQLQLGMAKREKGAVSGERREILSVHQVQCTPYGFISVQG